MCKMPTNFISCSMKTIVFIITLLLLPSGHAFTATRQSRILRTQMGVINKFPLALQASSADAFVPDMERRSLMNLILLGSAGLTVGGLGGPFIYFFLPPSTGGGGGGVTAKDALGADITSKGWLATHQSGSRELAQGLKGDATYLIVNDDNTINDYGLNAVCTHLGCVVPWVGAQGKFMCPCHGSQYDKTGKVIRGPAPLSLALAHATVDKDSDLVLFSKWSETDFRTNTKPWWN